MKIIYTLFLLALLKCIVQVYAQNETLHLLDELNDPSMRVRLSALEIINKENLTEYIPHLEELYYAQSEPLMKYSFLFTLKILGSENIISYCIDFINEADAFDQMFPPKDPLEMKVEATLLLLHSGYYETINYVFELIERDSTNITAVSLHSLELIADNVPESRTEVKEYLNFFIANSNDDILRSIALNILANQFGNESEEVLIMRSRSDPELMVRLRCLKNLISIKYPEIKNLLYERLHAEPERSGRLYIADTLLTAFGEPLDLQTVKTYSSIEPDIQMRPLFDYLVSSFKPHKPSIPTHEMIDSLNSYTDQLFQFSWIKNEEDYKHYKEKTKNLRELFEQNKTDELCSNLNWIISQAESHYGRDVLTKEGYKFLFYYTGYIKEKIETEFDCHN
ncbi:MAG: hypothetical protein IPM56_05240 [Ignavibacteriales bacterium]|nr:MAG: hypothetical protein IPM56_05240 [Ignavibacteriales bacterium]